MPACSRNDYGKWGQHVLTPMFSVFPNAHLDVTVFTAVFRKSVKRASGGQPPKRVGDSHPHGRVGDRHLHRKRCHTEEQKGNPHWDI
jgi:hypothetical protein